jgi:hypothetical protein
LEKSAINRYRLLVPKYLLERVDRTSSPAHAGNLRNAIDFIVPENTPELPTANDNSEGNQENQENQESTK